MILRPFEEYLPTIRTYLKNQQNSLKVIAISGPPLIGKTTLLSKLTAELGTMYYDGLLHLNLSDSQEKIDNEYRAFVGKMSTNSNSPDLAQLLEEKLSLHESGRWKEKRILFVFDNVQSEDQVRKYLLPSCAVTMIASRRKLPLEVEFGALSIQLTPLSNNLAIQKLTTYLPAYSDSLRSIVALTACYYPSLIFAISSTVARSRLSIDQNTLQQLASASVQSIIQRTFNRSSNSTIVLCSLVVLGPTITAIEASAIWNCSISVAELLLFVYSEELSLLNNTGQGRFELSLQLATASPLHSTLT